jgi:hypothetical protein
MKPLLLIALLLACTPPVAAVEPSSTAPLPYCFRVLAQGIGHPVLLAACAEDVYTCETVRELARRGGGSSLLAVGACKS